MDYIHFYHMMTFEMSFNYSAYDSNVKCANTRIHKHRDRFRHVLCERDKSISKRYGTERVPLFIIAAVRLKDVEQTFKKKHRKH